MSKKPAIMDHVLVPEHTKLSDKEKTELLEQLKTDVTELPKIAITDSAIQHLGVKPNDVIKIIRWEPTSGSVPFYRRVADE